MQPMHLRMKTGIDANQDTGRWIDKENERIEATVAAIEADAPAEQ